MRSADFSAASDLFGVSVAIALWDSLGGVGTGGSVPAPGIGGVVRVVPALPQTPRCASSVGGGGRVAGVAVDNVDMSGTNSGGVGSASGEKGILMRVRLQERSRRGTEGDGIADEEDEEDERGGAGGP